jgi:hypothetical protein
MRSIKTFNLAACLIVLSLLCVQPLFAQTIPTDVWVEVELLQVQTGVQNGEQDTRLLCTAVDGTFSETWLIVDRTAANMVAAGALTAYSLGHNVVIRIVPFGTGSYRVEKLRVVAP